MGMSLFFLVPIGILKAVSDTTIGLNVITECVARVAPTAIDIQIRRWLPDPRAADWECVVKLPGMPD